MKCSQTNTPDLNLQEDQCKGSKKSTTCVVHPTALISLGLQEGATQEEINNKLLLALQSALVRIEFLENQ